MSYTTDDLINGIKTRGSIPQSQTRFQSSDLLKLANDEILSFLLPRIKDARKAFFSYNYDQALNAIGIYRIPSRAAGASIEGIYLLDSSGKRQELPQVMENEVYDPNSSPITRPCFYFKGNNVVLAPLVPSEFATLRLSITMRPGTLALTTDCAQITSINSGTNTVTCDSVPSSWSTSSSLDLMRGTSGYESLSIDQTPSSVTTGTSGTIQFSSLPSDLAVGDWISLAGYSPVVQIPDEFFPVLEQRVANTCLRSLGLQNQLNAGLEALKEMEVAFTIIIPRSQNEPQRIVPHNGLLRRY